MAEKLAGHWFRRVLLDAIAALEKRPASRRGHYIITDAHLQNARAALQQEPTHDRDR